MIRPMMEAKFHHETAGFVNIIQLDRPAFALDQSALNRVPAVIIAEGQNIFAGCGLR